SPSDRSCVMRRTYTLLGSHARESRRECCDACSLEPDESTVARESCYRECSREELGMTTMIGPLRRALQVAKDRTAVRCGDVSLTYAETWDRATRLVGALRGLGVGDGERVAIVGHNCHRYLEIYHAVPGAGMVLVPLNQRHTPAELNYALQDSG